MRWVGHRLPCRQEPSDFVEDTMAVIPPDALQGNMERLGIQLVMVCQE